MKGFIEVLCYSNNSSYNKINTDKYLFPINKIAIRNSVILFNGKEYNCTISYNQIKELIKQAQ